MVLSAAKVTVGTVGSVAFPPRRSAKKIHHAAPTAMTIIAPTTTSLLLLNIYETVLLKLNINYMVHLAKQTRQYESPGMSQNQSAASRPWPGFIPK